MMSVLGAQLGVLHTALKKPKTLLGLDADYRSVGRLAKRMSKFATANCPYQTQPRTSVQLTVCAVL